MVDNLRQNFEKLVALYEGEKQKNAELQTLLKESREAVESNGQQITELKRQIDNLKLSSAFTGGGDNAVAKERIEKLIREIDRCIKLLED